MTDITQSHGTLCSMIEDSSTPSNNSEYFSVTSSLDILNCNDEVYYSMDEDLKEEINENNFSMYRRYECHDIMKENHKNLEHVSELRLSNSIETIPEVFVNEHVVNCEDWDKVCDNINSLVSQESVSTDEEDINNYSTLTESINNHSSVERRDSDNDENALISLNNNNTQMTNSILEGELSEMNDIIYESSLSQDRYADEEDNGSLKIEEKSEDIPQLEFTILNSEHTTEFTEPELHELENCSEVKLEIESEEKCINITENEIKSLSRLMETNTDSNQVSNYSIKKENEEVNVIPNKKIENGVKIEKSPKSKHVVLTEGSPTKSSSLCCAFRRKKRIPNPQKSKKSKSKSIFSFLRFYKKENSKLVSPIILPQANVDKEKEDLFAVVIENEEYQCIPFIDADVGMYSDSYIPLAKHEVFCE